MWEQDQQKKLLNVVFILDETGSMDIRKQATVSAYNEYVRSLRSQSNIRFTLMRFNSDRFWLQPKDVCISSVPELTMEEYKPAASTPLFDAVMRTITKCEFSGDTMCIILTDGEENASVETTRQLLFNRIQEKEKAGWRFVYLGANQDAWSMGSAMGFSKGNTMDFSMTKIREVTQYMVGNTVAYANASPEQRAALGSTLLQDKDKVEGSMK